MSSRNNKSIINTRKLVIVGDGLCGKTCLVNVFQNNRFLPNYGATTGKIYFLDIQLDGENHEMVVYDVVGDDTYDWFRSSFYANTNIVLVCFSVDRPDSATNIIEKWNSEIKHFCGQCSIILIACKIDLRTDPDTIKRLNLEGQKPVTSKFGHRLATQIKADAYLECSAKTGEGVQDVFAHAAHLSL